VRVAASLLLLGCAHDAPRVDVAPLPRVLRPPDLRVAAVFEPVGDPCENAQLVGAPISPECIVEGDTTLRAILADPACRVPLSAPDGFYCTRPHLLVDADPQIVVAPGSTAMVHVTLTPAADADVLVDFDPYAKLEVESSMPESSHLCLIATWATESTPTSDRARILLRPSAVVRAEIPWRATWTDADEHCNPVVRPLPRGHYTLAIPNPAYPIDLQRADWEYGTTPSVMPLERVGEVR
jgi:hypothetical protein